MICTARISSEEVRFGKEKTLGKFPPLEGVTTVFSLLTMVI